MNIESSFRVDPDSMNPIPIQGFDDHKLKKKNAAENFFIFF
jgi:hypothetical protein